jgi:hypothetical protein
MGVKKKGLFKMNSPFFSFYPARVENKNGMSANGI